jgi:AraC family transcriptional regulator of adaptative response/methylated-DNA-[protein]-cysteine methyltransferase
MKNETIHYQTSLSPYGIQLTAVSGKGICALWLGDSAEELEALLPDNFPGAAFVKVQSLSTQNLPLDFRGTPFQQKVWNALLKTKKGETLAYAELAQRIGAPKAVRAVASACGSNQIALLIPCHRIIRKDGKPSGYRWGIQRKGKILEQEMIVSCNVVTPN